MAGGSIVLIKRVRVLLCLVSVEAVLLLGQSGAVVILTGYVNLASLIPVLQILKIWQMHFCCCKERLN